MQNLENKIPNYKKALEFDEKILNEMLYQLVTCETIQQSTSAIDEIFLYNSFTEIL